MSECEAAQDAAVADLHAASGLGSHGEHFVRCADCRRFLVRTRRMSAAARSDEPSAAEILRLRVRVAPNIPGFGGARRRAPGRLRSALVLGLVLTATAAAAAGGGARLLEAVGLRRLASAAPAAGDGRIEAKGAASQQRAPRRAAPEPWRVERAAEVVPVERLALQSARTGAAPAPSAARSAKPRAAASGSKHEARWTDVAASLRARDDEGAQRALSELAQSSDRVTRDTARLSLAQLWLRQGKQAVAQELLRELASSGATPFIRRRAGELSD